ncbi:MAG: Nramp family divalent metal transporter [Actinomycetota bacterium]|nr:Nramp family divalent metal transporter [Actinomycetota bacterium]
MDRGRGSDADRPVDPEDGPRRVGDIREEKEGTSAEGRTEGDEHLRDSDAATNRATSDAGRDTGGVAAADPQAGWNIPSGVLPPIGSQDLPEPLPLSKLLGASVVILATATGSGEFIIWPYITTQIGIAFLWLAIIGFFVQYVMNMEIERYTLATGETAVTGFTRLWKPWGIFFVLGAVLPNAFPGWATGGATLFTYLFGFGSIPIIASIVLVATALALTLSPVVYQALEKIQAVLVLVIIAFILVGVVVATELGAWASVVTQMPGSVPGVPGAIATLGAATFLGAIAFAGAGGANNLTQSNYIRDKGLGMGSRMPKVVSPITGEEVAAPSLGYTFPVNEENMRRWRGWWSVANREHFITFFVIGCSLLIALSVLVWSTVGQQGIGTDLEFINTEAQVLGNQIGGWFQSFFLFAGMVVLFSTSIGIMDYVSRLSASELKISFFPGSQVITESRIYFTLAWVIAIGGSLILLAGLEAPLVLLIIAASGAGVVMAFYLGLLIRLNTRVLPDEIKLKGWRLAVMWPTFLVFVALSIYLVYYQIATNFFGAGG